MASRSTPFRSGSSSTEPTTLSSSRGETISSVGGSWNFRSTGGNISPIRDSNPSSASKELSSASTPSSALARRRRLCADTSSRYSRVGATSLAADPDPPVALCLMSTPSIRSFSFCTLRDSCRYSSISRIRSSLDGLLPGISCHSAWTHFLGKLVISHWTRENRWSEATSSTGLSLKLSKGTKEQCEQQQHHHRARAPARSPPDLLNCCFFH